MTRLQSVILAMFLAACCWPAAQAAGPAKAKSAPPKLEWGSWYTIGPFENKGGSGFDKAYPPEKGVD